MLHAKKPHTYLLWALLFVCLCTSQSSAGEPPDVLTDRDVRIESGQTIERLMVSGANAAVAGAVKEGIIIVDGNLTVEPGAWVEGYTIVLGGQAHIRQGSFLEYSPVVIAPAGFPFTRLVLGLLLTVVCLSLVILPYSLWGLLRLMRRFAPYRRLTALFDMLKRRWPWFYIALSLVVSGLLLLAFAEIAWQTMFRHTMGVFDNTFIWLVRYGASPVLDPIMILVSNLGYSYLYALIVGLSLSVLTIYRRWLELQALVLCLLGGSVLNTLLKYIFQRTRPEAFSLVEAAGYSFPSGHAMVSLCFYGMLAFLILRSLRSHHWRIAVLAGSLLLVGAIGVSRIYLGVHYPSDVLAGYIAGGTWLAFSISLLMWREHKRETEISTTP